MTHTLPVSEAAVHLAEYVDRVARQGETFLLTQDGQPVAELRPAAASKPGISLAEFLRSLPQLSDAEARSFADDIEAARATHSKAEPRNPWES